MAAPAWPSMTEGEWTKVATNVTACTLYRLQSKYKYYMTYVLTGVAAPLAAVKAKSPIIFQDSNSEEFRDIAAAIDIYIWPEDSTDSGDTITNGIFVVT